MGEFRSYDNAPPNFGADLLAGEVLDYVGVKKQAKILTIRHFSCWENHQGGPPAPDFNLLRKFV